MEPFTKMAALERSRFESKRMRSVLLVSFAGKCTVEGLSGLKNLLRAPFKAEWRAEVRFGCFAQFFRTFVR